MRVSIIMCTYNVEAFIDRAVQSVIGQTYEDWELIISDDASKDQTPQLISKYLSDSRIKYHYQNKNLGYVKNKNLALSLATGDLITQLDADDTCPPDRIEKQVQSFIDNPDVKICGTNYQMIDEDDNVIIPPKQYAENFIITEISKDYPFWFANLMFKRSLIDEFGLFCEYFDGLYGDDFHWTVMVNQKYPIYFIKDVLYSYRINSNSITNSFTNIRKLIAADITAELFRQQKETGTDWLAEGEFDKAKAFEEKLLNNKKLMADKYRIWAAKAIDTHKMEVAKDLLRRSFKLKKTNPDFYRTLIYYWRNKR